MYNKSVLQASLDLAPQSWVMAGINLRLRAEERELVGGGHLALLSSHADSDWACVTPESLCLHSTSRPARYS